MLVLPSDINWPAQRLPGSICLTWGEKKQCSALVSVEESRRPQTQLVFICHLPLKSCPNQPGARPRSAHCRTPLQAVPHHSLCYLHSLSGPYPYPGCIRTLGSAVSLWLITIMMLRLEGLQQNSASLFTLSVASHPQTCIPNKYCLRVQDQGLERAHKRSQSVPEQASYVRKLFKAAIHTPTRGR